MEWEFRKFRDGCIVRYTKSVFANERTVIMIYENRNPDYFIGYADIYDTARPKVPEYAPHTIVHYLGRSPEVVVDLGSGTGLSAEIWRGDGKPVKQIFGIEPNDDMRREAQKKYGDTMTFIKAYSDATGLEDGCADVVACSQAFHWMEPAATLHEVNRILRKGGVFATIDYDWPPVTLLEVEEAYAFLNKKIRTILKNNPKINSSVARHSKEGHLDAIRRTGYFRYAREILFCNDEMYTKEKLKKLMLSMSATQLVLGLQPDLIMGDIHSFEQLVDESYGEEPFNISFCYRMRIGVK